MTTGGGSRERGFALLVVLWVVVVLGALAGRLAAEGRFDAGATFNERCRLTGHYAAYAGLEDARERLVRWVSADVDPRPEGFLVTVPEGQAGPEEHTGGEVGEIFRASGEVGGARYRVRAVDLNSRLDVNRADERMLERLFQGAGIPAGPANALVDAILDWIDGDDLHRPRGAEAAAYARGLGPRNGPVPSLAELLQVRGMTPEILYGEDGDGRGETSDPSAGGGLARWLTVEGTGRVNLNTAPPEVLAALPGFDPDVVAIVVDLRKRSAIRSISEVAADPRLAGGPMRLQDVAMQLIRGTTTRSEGMHVRALGEATACPVAAGVDAILELDSEGRIAIASWREWQAAAEDQQQAVAEDQEGDG